MKYVLKFPNGSAYDYTLDEIQREVAQGKLPEGCTFRKPDSQDWQPISALFTPYPSTDTDCYIVTGGERKGPFRPEQLETMWSNGGLTAESEIHWDGSEEPAKYVKLREHPLYRNNTLKIGSECSSNNKVIGGVLLLIGAALLIGGIARLNSIESQFIRGFGGTDGMAITLFVIGIPTAIAGVIMLMKGQAASSFIGVSPR